MSQGVIGKCQRLLDNYLRKPTNFQKYPDDYLHDVVRENKFGFTFAPNGFLIRR